jgi:hypothetical protein
MTCTVLVATSVRPRTDARRFVVDAMAADATDRAGYESM